MAYHYTPIRMLGSRTLITPNTDGDVEQQEFTFTAGGDGKWPATLKDSLAVSHRTEHSIAI